MSRALGWGNNVCGNLDPSADPLLLVPTDLTQLTGGGKVLWHSWNCTIVHSEKGLRFWGQDPLLEVTELSDIAGSELAHTVIGNDRPMGFLIQDGRFHTFDGRTASERWITAAADNQGRAYIISANGLSRFDSLDACLKGEKPTKMDHPLIYPIDESKLYATENKVFLVSGSGRHLFQITEENTLSIVEEVEGLGLAHVVCGTSNTLGLVMDSGDAYTWEARASRPTLLELPRKDTSVRLLGVGSRFLVIVADDGVWTKGDNTFHQLGVHEDKGWNKLDIEAESVMSVSCGRWSCIVTLHVK